MESRAIVRGTEEKLSSGLQSNCLGNRREIVKWTKEQFFWGTEEKLSSALMSNCQVTEEVIEAKRVYRFEVSTYQAKHSEFQ